MLSILDRCVSSDTFSILLNVISHVGDCSCIGRLRIVQGSDPFGASYDDRRSLQFSRRSNHVLLIAASDLTDRFRSLVVSI